MGEQEEDPNLAVVRSHIAEFGLAIRHVAGDDEHAPFSYTIGLTAIGHPEIVMTGMPFEYAQQFLNLIGRLVREGGRFQVGMWTEALTDAHPQLLIAVDNTSELTAVEQLYGDVHALQLVWSDSHGNFPWQSGWRNPLSAQPLLGPLPPNIEPRRPSG
jgi:hypothetical protein